MNADGISNWGTGAKVLALIVGLAAWLLVFEIGVRIFVDESLLPRFVIDAGYGVRANQPNVVTRHYYPGDYDVTISTNSAGMRGRREYPIEKADGVYRVMILGDSMGFGFGAEDDEVVSAVLEDTLNKLAGSNQRYEVLNLSVSGFGQAEQLITYREQARNYSADTVVLLYYDNDIGNNQVSQLFELDDQKIIRRTGKSYLPAVKMREMLYSVPPIQWLFEHSQAWNFVRNRLSAIVQKSLLRQQGLTTFSTDDPEAVALTVGLLQQLLADIRTDGADPVIVIIPTANRLSNFPMSAEAVGGLGATIVDGREFLTRQDYFVYDTHIRPNGHLKIALQLSELLATH